MYSAKRTTPIMPGTAPIAANRMPDRMRPGIPTEPAKACASLSYSCSCSCSCSCGIVLEHEQEHVRVRNQREFTVFHTFTARNSSAGNTRVHFPVVERVASGAGVQFLNRSLQISERSGSD